MRGIHNERPADPDALHRMYARPQLRYAATVLADMRAAESDRRAPPLPHIALNWAVVLFQEGGPEANAWRALKMRVER
ncbi:hypothetical protein AB0N06_32370 [Streptomyces sp. NPDC051020]|uniref:hypothetical protein n=1 Tax=Streptomyces sp. NPDC051020 TaxID=3155409 RepID=UPI003425FDDF